jgi:hypothetical protein
VLIGTTTTQTGAVLAVTGGIQGTIASGTTVASTSGTTIDFTAIPSWVKRITVMLAGVSFTTGSNIGIQLGVGGVAVTTGYSSVTQFSQTGNAPTVGAYTATIVSGAGFSASVLYNGIVTIAYMGSNKWVASSILNSDSSVAQATSSGYIALSGVLDMVRVMGGTFDAGSINILFEG